MPQGVYNSLMQARPGAAPDVETGMGTMSKTTPPPGANPNAAVGRSPGNGASPSGGDPLVAALANLNNILQGVVDGAIPLTQESGQELKVTLSLLSAIAGSQGGQAQGAPPPGMSQAGPGNTQLPGGGGPSPMPPGMG